MASSQAAIMYDVWTFHSILAETGISQAGVILIYEGGKAVENDYHLSVYHTSRDLSRWHYSYKQSLQCSLGGNMIYKGKIFGDDKLPFDAICRSVEPMAKNLGVPLNGAADWIETWEDYMSRANIAHILFDRPEKRHIDCVNSDAHSQSRNDYPPAYFFESVDWGNIAHEPRSDVLDQNSYGKSRSSNMEPHHKYYVRQRYISRELDSSDDDSDYSGEREEFHGSRSARHSHLPRVYRSDDEPSEKPENKKLKYAGIIAEIVTTNAIGDVFGLIFESVIGAIL